MGRGAAFLIVVAAILISLYTIQRNLDTLRSDWPEKEELLYLPSGNMITVISLGFDQLVADILYIRMIDYFSTHLMTDHTYVWFYHIADLITTLDPQFRFPYMFAGLNAQPRGRAVRKRTEDPDQGSSGSFPTTGISRLPSGLTIFSGVRILRRRRAISKTRTTSGDHSTSKISRQNFALTARRGRQHSNFSIYSTAISATRK